MRRKRGAYMPRCSMLAASRRAKCEIGEGGGGQAAQGKARVSRGSPVPGHRRQPELAVGGCSRGRLSLHFSPMRGRGIFEGRHRVLHFSGERLPLIRICACASSRPVCKASSLLTPRPHPAASLPPVPCLRMLTLSPRTCFSYSRLYPNALT